MVVFTSFTHTLGHLVGNYAKISGASAGVFHKVFGHSAIQPTYMDFLRRWNVLIFFFSLPSIPLENLKISLKSLYFGPWHMQWHSWIHPIWQSLFNSFFPQPDFSNWLHSLGLPWSFGLFCLEFGQEIFQKKLGLQISGWIWGLLVDPHAFVPHILFCGHFSWIS